MKMQIHSSPLGAALWSFKNSGFFYNAVHKADLLTQTRHYRHDEIKMRTIGPIKINESLSDSFGSL